MRRGGEAGTMSENDKKDKEGAILEDKEQSIQQQDPPHLSRCGC